MLLRLGKLKRGQRELQLLLSTLELITIIMILRIKFGLMKLKQMVREGSMTTKTVMSMISMDMTLPIMMGILLMATVMELTVLEQSVLFITML